MSTASELELAAAELRAAVERRDFAAASIYGARYGQVARETMAGLPAEAAARRVAAVRAELEDARRKLCTARARIRHRLQLLRQASAYSAAANPVLHTWRLSA